MKKKLGNVPDDRPAIVFDAEALEVYMLCGVWQVVQTT